MNFSRLTLGGATVSALALAGVLATPGAASAQYYGGYSDPCRTPNATGALVGAGVGAAIGSGVAARGAREEGAAIRGLLGATLGASAGRSNCYGYDNRYYSPPS